MEHVPDDPRQEYRITTLYVEDVQQVFEIAAGHGATVEATFEQLTPAGGKWRITKSDDLPALASKFRESGAIVLDIDTDEKEWDADDITIRGDISGLRMYGGSTDKARKLFIELHAVLRLLSDEHGKSSRYAEVPFFKPTKRPPKEPTFWKRNREHIEKAFTTKLVDWGIAFVLGGIVTFLGFKAFVSAPTPPAPSTPTSQVAPHQP